MSGGSQVWGQTAASFREDKSGTVVGSSTVPTVEPGGDVAAVALVAGLFRSLLFSEPAENGVA